MRYLQAPQPKPRVRFRLDAAGLRVFNAGHWVEAGALIHTNVVDTLHDMVKYSKQS